MRDAVKAGVAAGVFGAVVLLWGAPAGGSLDGPCQARGEFTPAEGATGPDEVFTVDAATASGTIEVPDEASVAWFGQIGDGQDTEPRETSGSVSVVLPPVIDLAFGGLAEVYTWGEDDAVTTQEPGTENYDIPDIAPAGAQIVVSGSHEDTLGDCSGEVTLKLAGNPVTEPITIGMVVLTLGAGALLVLAGRP
jgi:hypothetical protein